MCWFGKPSLTDTFVAIGKKKFKLTKFSKRTTVLGSKTIKEDLIPDLSILFCTTDNHLLCMSDTSLS